MRSTGMASSTQRPAGLVEDHSDETCSRLTSVLAPTLKSSALEGLDRRARLIRGKPRELGMLAGLQADAHAAMFVGYHARADVGRAVLAHTMAEAKSWTCASTAPHTVRSASTPLLAGSYGVL